MSDKEKLRAMVAEYPTTIEDLSRSIDSIDALILDLQEQKEAILDAVMAPIVSASNLFLEQEAADYGPTYTYCTSGDYGNSNITEWSVIEGTCNGPHRVVLESSDLEIAPSGSVEALQLKRQSDFEEAYDHIHATVGLGGTYGINDTISNLQTSRGILVINKNKIETILPIYSEHTD